MIDNILSLHGGSINTSGHLEIGGVDVIGLTKEYGTPLYVLNEDMIRERCRQYKNAFDSNYPDYEIIYAGKVFLTQAICKVMDSEKMGLDVVSGGELYTALKAGFPPSGIYFHGNNKSIKELEIALDAGIGRIVVDNMYELEILIDLAKAKNTSADILLRVSPGVEAHTHSYIKTGQVDSKFGFSTANEQFLKALRKASESDFINFWGLHCHIGSQIFDISSFKVTADVMVKLLYDIKNELKIKVRELDMGGGLGISYTRDDKPPSIHEFSTVISNGIKDACKRYGLALPKLIVEPGRSIIGDAGITLYQIGSIKDIPGIRTYVSVDGGMADNPRVALYDAKYEAILANKADHKLERTVSITGKCCESGDMLIWDIDLPKVEPEDIIAVFSTGAYNYSMSSNYNKLPRPGVVLVTEGKSDLIVKPETYDDLLRNDILPPRLRSYKK